MDRDRAEVFSVAREDKHTDVWEAPTPLARTMELASLQPPTPVFRQGVRMPERSPMDRFSSYDMTEKETEQAVKRARRRSTLGRSSYAADDYGADETDPEFRCGRRPCTTRCRVQLDAVLGMAGRGPGGRGACAEDWFPG